MLPTDRKLAVRGLVPQAETAALVTIVVAEKADSASDQCRLGGDPAPKVVVRGMLRVDAQEVRDSMQHLVPMPRGQIDERTRDREQETTEQPPLPHR